VIKLEEQYLKIADITRYQGNKGEVRAKAVTEIPERFFDLEKVYIKKDGEILEFTVDYIRFQKQFVIIKFFEVNSIGEAEELRNTEVLIDKSERYLLPEDNYYIEDLIDCSVYKKDNQYLGKLKDVVTTAGTDIFIVKGKDKEYMLPASREIIIEIDLEAKKIIVDPIPGLLEL